MVIVASIFLEVDMNIVDVQIKMKILMTVKANVMETLDALDTRFVHKLKNATSTH